MCVGVGGRGAGRGRRRSAVGAGGVDRTGAVGVADAVEAAALAGALGAGRGGAWSRTRPRAARVVPVQVVLPHQADQLGAVARVGGVHAGQRGGERVGRPPHGHRLPVVAAVGQQPAVVIDALGEVVVHPERRRRGDPLAVLVFLRRQRVAARRAGALHAEQVVILAGQQAVAPVRLLDGLGDGHRRGHPVAALRGDRAGGHRVDERLLRRAVSAGGGAGGLAAGGRRRTRPRRRWPGRAGWRWPRRGWPRRPRRRPGRPRAGLPSPPDPCRCRCVGRRAGPVVPGMAAWPPAASCLGRAAGRRVCPVVRGGAAWAGWAGRRRIRGSPRARRPRRWPVRLAVAG